MTAEILALCLCELAHRGGASAGGIVGKTLAVAMPTPEVLQIRTGNICRIKCLQTTVKYTVRSSALDWQLNGVARRANVL